MSQTDPNLADAAIAMVGHRTAQGGAGASVLGWVTSSEAGVVLGIVIGVVGLLVQWYYNRRRDKREEAESAWRMRGGAMHGD